MTAAVADTRRGAGTGLLRTQVSAVAGGWRWERTTGSRAPAPFPSPAGPPPVGPPQAEPAVDDPEAVRLVRGDGDDRRRRYLVRGPESAAAVLLREGPAESLVPLLRGVGVALRGLHCLPAPARPNPGLTRLGSWLDGRARELDASQAAGYARDRLGEQRWRTLRSWRADAAEPGPVRSHGAASLGSLVPAAGAAGGDLLIGEDECAGSPAVDLGWLVGEVVELAAASPHPPADWQRLLAALVDGYGAELGEDCHRVAALRVALHLHDHTAYVGWSRPDVDRYVRLIAVLVPA